MKNSPRRILIFALSLFFSFCCVSLSIAQSTAKQSTSQQQNASNAHVNSSVPLRRIVAARTSGASEGARVVIASDAPIDDYSSRLDGGNFQISIPHARASFSDIQVAGRGFITAGIEQRDESVILSFRLERGASVSVTRGFNRLEVIFKTTAQPAASASSEPSSTKTTDALTDGPSDERETIRQMRAQIDALETRIREIEAKQAAQPNSQQQTAQAAPASATVAVNSQPASAAPADKHDQHDDMSNGRPNLQIQGFADVNYHVSDQKGTTNSFALGQLDLFLTSRLSEKFSVLGELIVEAGQDNAFTFEVHRLLLRYTPNDYFNFSAGRYHTAIGYYNTAYHHGSWFQTAANRPFIFAFEGKGGILPLHNVGVSVTGRIPRAPFGLRYVAEIGNGRASRSPLDRAVQTAVDENNGKAFNLGIFARPKSIPGFQTGFSYYRDRLTPAGKPKVGQSIFAAHLVYQNRLYEFLNEAVFVRHTVNNLSFVTPGLYTQFSRRFGNARPYLRYQYVSVPANDPIFPDVGQRIGPSVGLRYDITDFAAFKAQYDRTRRRSLSTLDELILQLAFTF